MRILPYIYLFYMFVSLYFLSLYIIVFLRNRKRMFAYPSSKTNPSVSFIIPAYNEGKTIGDTIQAIFNSDYQNILEIIVVNDGSKDNTREAVESLLEKYPKLKLINNKKNLGNAAKSQNVGLKYAKGEIIAVVDADSYPAKHALTRMIGFFDDRKVGAVTCPSRAKNRNKFIEKLQAIEYNMIAFSRKLLDYLDAIYVTPGTLALYRREALLEIGGFDEENMTQDIEATWHITYNGWDRRMCLDTYVETTVPSKFKAWFKQRRRWNIGGLQCIGKYKKFFMKKGMLGAFILPFFILQLFLGMIGLAVFFYLLIRGILKRYLFTNYAFEAGTSLLTLQDLNITPSFLNYLGVILFVLGAIFTFIVLYIMKENIIKKQNIFNIMFYMIVYLTVYPFIMISAIYNFIRKKNIWR